MERDELQYAIAWTVAFSLFGDGYIHAYTDSGDTGEDLAAHMAVAKSAFIMHHRKKWIELGLNTAIALAEAGSAAYSDKQCEELAKMRKFLNGQDILDG